MSRIALSHSSNTNFRRLPALSLAALSLAALGCSADEVELGGSDTGLPGAATACGGGIVEGDVITYDQAEIDALAGCTEIRGKLLLHNLPGMDLSPLSSLRSVRDSLQVGVQGTAPLASLHGLEALEHVGGLTINRLEESDLRGLRNLRSIRAFDPEQTSGYLGLLELSNCAGLSSLHGLEQLADWNVLLIQNAESLHSLDGLIPPPTGASVWVNDARYLSDISALGAARSMESIRLEFTGVENLDGVELETLQSLFLSNNSALVHLDGLNHLHELTELVVFENRALERLPSLPNLVLMRSLQITSNDSLLSVPAYRSVLEHGGRVLAGDFTRRPPNNPPNVPVGFDFFVIGGNAALQTASAPPGFMNGGHVAVFDNPSLTQLELSGLAEADQLIIRGNAQLSLVDVSSLELTRRLEVVDNPLLPLSTFDSVAAAFKQMAETAVP